MDVWKPQELAMMRFGGNQRLADYMDEHGPKDWRKMPITQKYDTKAAKDYRQQLKAEIHSGAAPPPKKAPAPSPAPSIKTSMFDLFDLAETAETVVDSLITKPVRSAEKQKQLDVASAELKRLQAKATPEVGILPKPCALEAAKPEVKANVTVDIWGDDLWD